MFIVMIENAVKSRIARKNPPQGAKTARSGKRASWMKLVGSQDAVKAGEK
jgi:hypothetical protein